MLWPFLIGGAILLAVAKKPANPFKFSISNSLVPIAEYKAQLYNKIIKPAVAKEIASWSKSRILSQVDAMIPAEHKAVVKAVIEHESQFNPAALAGYKKGKQTSYGTNSTAFGLMQVLRSTFEDVNKGQLQFRHEDLWYPPFAIAAGYATLQAKLKKAKGDIRKGLAYYAGKDKATGDYNYGYADEVASLTGKYT